MRSRKSRRGATTRRCSSWRTSSSCRAPDMPRRRSRRGSRRWPHGCATRRCPCQLRLALHRAPRSSSGARSAAARCAHAGRFVHRDSAAPRIGRIHRGSGARGRRNLHRTTRALLARRCRRDVRQITCMKRITTTRTRTTGGKKRLPAEVTRAVRAAVDKKATDVVVLDLRNAGVHRLLRDLLGAEHAAGQGDRRQRRGHAARGRRAAGARRRLRPRRMDPARLLHFIVHVFAPQTRVFYGLERLWGNAERIEMTDEPPDDKQKSARL